MRKRPGNASQPGMCTIPWESCSNADSDSEGLGGQGHDSEFPSWSEDGDAAVS